MYSKKRKTSYLELNYNQEDEEEEDEWEREASCSSSKNKPLPPNPYAIQVDILNNQHVFLNETLHNLTEQLEQLERELDQLEQEESKDTSKLQQEYIHSIEETVSLIHATVNSSEQESYHHYEELQTKDIEKLASDWIHVLASHKQQDKNQLESLAHAYRSTEFDVVDLISQINGYEARIQVLDRERAKLNSLPQIIPILTSETEKVSGDMKKTTIQLEDLEKNALRPQLKQLADINVMIPFQQGQLTKDLDLMRDLKNELDKAQHILVKQRACQQMMAYIHDASRTSCKNKLDAIKSVVEAIEDQNLIHVDIPLENKNASDSQLHITTIKNLLAEFFQDKSDPKEKTLLEQIHALKHYEAQLKSKWQDDFQSCLDAAQELGALQRRLQETLYTHSSSNENLILTPKPYTSLQSELEFRTLEIKAALSELEKNLNNTDNKTLFEQQKKLFALFFTDPISFEQLHSNIVNK